MPIPTKGFFDPDPEPESIQHNEQIREEFRAIIEQQDREQAALNAKFKADEDARLRRARDTDIANLERYVGLATDQMTRDMLLDRIRKMREEKPKEYEPPPLSEADKERLAREQKAGREALAMVQAKMGIGVHSSPTAPETTTNEMVMTPAVHPNPSQDEIYPTVESTLPPKPQRPMRGPAR